MKALLLFLLTLTVAPSLDAQERLAPVWAARDLNVDTGFYEDGMCVEMLPQGTGQGQHLISFDLPRLSPEPDSVTFIVKGDAEFYGYSEYRLNMHRPFDFKTPVDSFTAITFKYSRHPTERVWRVGIALNNTIMRGPRFGEVNEGSICVDAAYVTYSTATVLEGIIDQLINTQQVNWWGPRSIDARSPEFYGTLKELKASGLKGQYFSLYGKYILNE